MAKSPTTEMNSPLEPEKVIRSLAEVQMSGLGSLSWLGTKWVETMSDFGSEWLNFVAERVKEDVKLQHQLLHAKDVATIQKLQAQYLQKTMDDYHDETGKMVQFCSDAMADIQAKAKEVEAQSKT